MRICGLWWFYCSHSGGWMPLSCGGAHWWGRWGQVGRPSIEAGPSRDNGIVTMLICTQPPVISSCWPTHNQGHHLPFLCTPPPIVCHSYLCLRWLSHAPRSPSSAVSRLCGDLGKPQSLLFSFSLQNIEPLHWLPSVWLWSISINCTWTCNISHHCHRGFS